MDVEYLFRTGLSGRRQSVMNVTAWLDTEQKILPSFHCCSIWTSPVKRYNRNTYCGFSANPGSSLYSSLKYSQVFTEIIQYLLELFMQGSELISHGPKLKELFDPNIGRTKNSHNKELFGFCFVKTFLGSKLNSFARSWGLEGTHCWIICPCWWLW